jgi:Capsular polysaccharide synthesis protein
MNDFKVFVYWENKNNAKAPLLVEECYKTMKKNIPNIIFLNDKNLHKYVSGLVDTKHLKYLAQKVDYIRAKIIYENGGMWLDSDTIVLDNFNDIIQHFINSKCTFWGHANINTEKPIVNISHFMAKKDCEQILKSKRKIGWSEIGGHLLGKIIVRNNNFINQIMAVQSNFNFFYGYRNYIKYYETDSNIIEKELDKISKYKIVILYGTYMYNNKIGNDCLLKKLLFE